MSAIRLAAIARGGAERVSDFAFVFASFLTVGMAYLAIRRRRIDAHREWMIRGYVVTLGFTTIRTLSELPVFISLGEQTGATVIWVGWAIPLMLTEVALQWRRTVGPVAAR